jgi:hypothetical protein
MNRLLVALGLSLLAGVLAFFAMRSHALKDRSNALLVDQQPELAWLKSELQLKDAEISKVRAMHLEYRPKCLEMCKRIAQARMNLQAVSQSERAWTPALERAILEHAKVQADCKREMLKHLYDTAAVLRPEKAERFLQATLPAALGGYHGDGTDSCHAD